MTTRNLVGGSVAQLDPLLILHSLIDEPDCLERGLRLLALDRPSAEACTAWGLDAENRPVGVCVTSREVGSDDLRKWLASNAAARPAERRLLVLAPRFLEDPEVNEWIVEPWLWGREGSEGDAIWIERLEPREEADVDLAAVRLTRGEVASLLGVGPAVESGP